MHTVARTLLGLTLVALAAPARAQDAAPPGAPEAPAAPPATPEVPVAPPATTTPAPRPPGAAPIAVVPPALVAPAAAAASAPRRVELGLSFLPMGLGKFTSSPGGMTSTVDAAFSYGFSLQAGYVVLPGLTVGLAPQAFFNVKPKDQTTQPTPVSQELDIMARVAYAFRVVDTIALYAEVLPGYSLIHPSGGDVSKGVVLAGGVGAATDLSDRLFASLGVGYQVGAQRLPAKDLSAEAKTRYVRVTLGVGARF
jgi:Outer membrane protein beta-barrel domain